MAERVGKEEFRRAITVFRNRHIVAALAPLIEMRKEVIASDDLSSRAGVDGTTRDHFVKHLQRCDRIRRWVTHNPDNEPLGDKIAKAIDANAPMDEGQNPFGGDDIQQPSAGLIDLPWRLDGTDPDIPLRETADPDVPKAHQYRTKGEAGILVVGAINEAILLWTRINSRDRSAFITKEDSMRIYGVYQNLLGYFRAFCGDDNRADFAQVLASDEPLGPHDSANRVSATTGAPAATK